MIRQEHPIPNPEHTDSLAPVIDIAAHREGVDRVVFSDLGIDACATYFISQLRHPSRNDLRGVKLAEFITESIGGIKPTPDPGTLEGRIVELMRWADDDYDAKEQSDPVFRTLSQLLLKKQSRDLAPQRKAARSLLELRSALTTFTTPDDPDWYDVIERLL